MSNYLTLANSIIGASILAMPYCFAKCGIILSILLLVISTFITRVCCNYLIKASIVTRRKNMEQLGFEMFGLTGKFIVEISVIGFLMGTCVAFYVVIGDLSPLIISKIIDIQHYDPNSVRKLLIVVITLTTIVPLSLQRSIESLTFVCKASIGFYICLTLKIVFESFKIFDNYEHATVNLEYWNNNGIIQCIPIFSMALSCQMQLFEVYEAMPSNQGSFDSIKKTVNVATFLCFIVYTVVGFFGYIAFNTETLGNILMNLPPSSANDAIIFGFILSIACSFPLVIFPCRSALSSLLHRTQFSSEFSTYVPESKYHFITLSLIFSTMILGILVPSVEVVISLLGSTIGIVVCVIFPATCFVKIMKRNSIEKRFAQVMIVLGFLVMILGTYSNLMAIESANSGVHLQSRIIEKLVEHPRNINIIKNNRSEAQNIVIDKKLSADGIKKEEMEILAAEKSDLKDVRKELQEKNEEIQELIESKDHLEKKMEIVIKKFEDLAEKVEKIEKKTADDEIIVSDKVSPKMTNISVAKSEIKTKDNILEAVKVAEIVNVTQEIGQKNLKAASPKLIPLESPQNTLNLMNDTNKKLPVDSVVKFIKSNEPLSYQVGEKLAEHKKPNDDALKNSGEIEVKKNEMRRKKREAKLDELNIPNLQFHSLIGRELKSTKLKK